MLYNERLIIENREGKLKLVKEYHTTPHSRHFGVWKTLKKTKPKIHLAKYVSNDKKNFVKQCHTCLTCKQTKHTKEPLAITPTPSTSFETLRIDTVAPVRPTNNFRYILTTPCELTIYMIAYPIENKNATPTSKTLVEDVIRKYGQFRTFKSDGGTECNKQLMKEICLLLGIEQKFFTL